MSKQENQPDEMVWYDGMWVTKAEESTLLLGDLMNGFFPVQPSRPKEEKPRYTFDQEVYDSLGLPLMWSLEDHEDEDDT